MTFTREPDYYHPSSAHSNAVALLSDGAPRRGVHMDIGCGYGIIAEPVRDELGRTYIGFDVDDEAMASLRRRGFETHRVDLTDSSDIEKVLLCALGGRPIASLSVLDALDHLPQGAAVLAALCRVASPSNAPLVVTVSNVAREDMALRLLLGRWGATEDKAFDQKPAIFYDHDQLSRLMEASGWRQVGARDWPLMQDGPETGPVVDRATPIGRFLHELIGCANPHASVDRFVRIYLPDEPLRQPALKKSVETDALSPPALLSADDLQSDDFNGVLRDLSLLTSRDFARLLDDKPLLRELLEAYWPNLAKGTPGFSPDGPFLSVIIRTQGTRPITLNDALMSLVHQTSQDFEIILVVHSQGVEVAAGVWEAVEEIRRILGNRIKLVTCNRIGRAAPLNDGVAQARGQYVTLLDDDDIALAHWVETFQKLAFQAPSGSLLRAACVRQDFAAADNLSAAPQALSEFKSDYPLSFNMLSHLSENSTPAMCVAYPVGVFQQDGLRFDEGLSTVEDWDFLMRAVMLRGIVSTPEVTSIYRWGAAADTSSTMHEPSEWVANLAAVHKKLDLAPVLLPTGFASELRSLRETYFKAAIQLMMIGGTIPSISDDLELTKIVDRMLIGHLGSLSWRLTRPLRQILRWSMRQPSSEWTIEHIPLSLHERLLILQQIQHSWSWKITHPLRILARVAPRLRSLMSR
jgi:hypothetical protein